MAASYSPRVRHFELKFQSFADEGFPRDHASETQKLEWNLELGDYNLYSQGVFSAFYGEQQKKKTFFCCQKGHSLRTDAFSPKKAGETISLLDFFWGEGGVCTQLYNFINTYHTLEEKIHKNSQSRGLKWPKVSKKKKKMWRIYRNRRRL